MPETVALQIRISHELNRKLLEEARDRGISKSGLVRMLLTRGLEWEYETFLAKLAGVLDDLEGKGKKL